MTVVGSSLEVVESGSTVVVGGFVGEGLDRKFDVCFTRNVLRLDEQNRMTNFGKSSEETETLISRLRSVRKILVDLSKRELWKVDMTERKSRNRFDKRQCPVNVYVQTS